MPIYEYRCPACGEFEVTQRITESPLKRCPTCRAKVTKLISSTTFHLKGSGWYVTDYGRSGSSDKTSKSETEPAAKTEKTDTSSASESKPTKANAAAAA